MKQRVITATILVAIAVFLFLLPTSIAKYAIAVGVSIIAALAYKETLGLTESHKPYPNIIKVLGFICMEMMVFNSINASYIYNGASFIAIGLTILLLVIPSIFDKKGKYTTKEAFYLIGSTLMIGIFFNLLMLIFNANKWLSILFFIISLVSITVMYILDIVNYIIFKESNIYGAVYSHQKFSKDMGGIRLIFLKIFLNIIFLPYEMWENLDSIIRSFYRMTKKKKLLEWVTAEDGDKSIKNNLLTVYKHMWINIFLGIVFILVKSNFIFKIIGILFLIAPYVVFVISKINKPEDIVNTKDRKELNEIAYKTWKFFEDNINEKNNYLICDNYQEDRKEKTVNRTSSTNIGLELISILSAFDLGFIDFDKTKWYLKNIFNVLRILSKWNGHLYNWYETDTLDPLRPRYISTVDSGNFVRIFIYCKIIFE